MSSPRPLQDVCPRKNRQALIRRIHFRRTVFSHGAWTEGAWCSWVEVVRLFAISIFIEAWRRKYNDKQPKKGLGGLVEKIRIREVSFRSLFGQRRQLDLQAMEAEAVTMGAQAARAVWTYEALGFPRAGDYSLVLFR